ncbi:MAG TPA: flagellar motor switch protein FliN [Firmicutes bacterium]|nr:flagellar motor switch protein FliN [Bacillota bacterium]
MSMSQDEIDKLMSQTPGATEEPASDILKIFEKMSRLYSNSINNIFPILIETEHIHVEPGMSSKGQFGAIIESQPSNSTYFTFKSPDLTGFHFIGMLDLPIALSISQRMMGQEGETVLTEALISALAEAYNNILGAWDAALAEEFGYLITHGELKFHETDAATSLKNETGYADDTPTVISNFSINIDDLQGGISLMISADGLKQVYDKHPSSREAAKTQPTVPTPTETEKVPTPEPETMSDTTTADTSPRKEPEIPTVRFEELAPHQPTEQPRGIDLILDVPLVVTVELGRKSLSIKEILELVPGSLVELEKLAGEAVDLLVNGKLFAKGEVVVIDENFGVRVSTIISPKERIENLR